MATNKFNNPHFVHIYKSSHAQSHISDYTIGLLCCGLYIFINGDLMYVKKIEMWYVSVGYVNDWP